MDAWNIRVLHFFCCTIRNLKILTRMEIPNNTSNNSNHRALKMTFWAALVPKSFSTKVATPMATANSLFI